VYFNGYGPCREYVVDIPGGTGYQTGQINAEKLIDITYGEDVPQEYIDGTYTIMNYNNKMLLALPSTTSSSGTQVQCITRKNNTTATQQQWSVTPKNISGDCSYWTILLNTEKKMYLDLLNWNLNTGASAIAYQNTGNIGENEQWYLKYAGEGYWYIINRYSNKALYCSSSTSGSKVFLGECPTKETSQSIRKRYMWRFQKLDAPCNNTAPTWDDANITVNEFVSSVRLNWTAINDTTVKYNILRAPKSTGEYNTIARSVSGNTFLDNSTIGTTEYIYKVIPVAYNGTRGLASNTIEAKATGTNALIMQLQFENNLSDNSINQLNSCLYGTPYYSSLIHMSGLNSFNMSKGNSYIEIPYSATNLDSMTIAFWTRWSGSSSWERIFDFGNGTNNYMFFTPSNGTEMRFVMKNGGEEQIITTGKKLTKSKWTHVAVSIKPLQTGYVEVKLYLDGKMVISSQTFTIKPSDIAPVLNYIGRSQFASDPFFKGYIDDFRIYNYALTDSEVNAIVTDLDEASKDLDDDSTDLDGIKTNIDGTVQEVFSINGLQLQNATKGINIVRKSDGSVKKIIK
jgi:hypothetical protein